MFTVEIGGIMFMMAKELLYIEAVKNIKGNFLKAERKVTEFIGIWMKVNIMDIGKMIWKMEMVNSDILMEIFIKVIGSKEWNMEKESLH